MSIPRAGARVLLIDPADRVLLDYALGPCVLLRDRLATGFPAVPIEIGV